MGVLHRESMRASAPPFHRLLRRLMIACPETGRPADTGFELSALPGIAGPRQVLVDCLECGQDHSWESSQATLAGPVQVSSSQWAW